MIKTPLKLTLITILVAVVSGVGFYLLLSQLNPEGPVVTSRDPLFGWKFPVDTPSPAPVDNTRDPLFGWKYPVTMLPDAGPEGEQIAYSDIRDPGGIAQGLPVRLKVPAIGVNSVIEDAFITPEGRMDVPQGSVNVAWFALGPPPGQTGSAVIGGHFGISNGVKFVFYDLDKLVVGDKIYIEDDRGKTLAFQVRKIELFKRDADATTVFTSNDGKAHLNLITCEGIWNRINDTYPDRRVVFTDAIPFEGTAPSSVAPRTSIAPTTAPVEGIAPAVAPFQRLLSIGMRGADVVALQTILVEKRFLIIPRGVSMGYFGTLTRTALTKYQTSVGLPSTGILDLSTRVELNPRVAIKPTLPSTAATPEPTPEPTSAPMPNFPIQLVKSLYLTPIDGLVTSILILSIIFTVFHIIKNRFKK